MRNHNLVSSLASFTVLGVFALLAAGSGSSDGAAPPTAASAPGATAAAPAQAVGLNQAVRLGDTSVTVTGVSSSASVGGEIFREQAGAGATFVVVRYSETNHGNETLTVLGSPFKLVDAQGRRYEPSSRGEGAVAASEQLQLIPQLQPGLASTNVAVFEVPSAAATGTINLEFQERGFLGTGRATITAPVTVAAAP